MRKTIISLALAFLSSTILLSCKKRVDCYQCYYGNQLELNTFCDYGSINQNLITNNLKEYAETDKYFYFDFTYLSNQDDVSGFLNRTDLFFTDLDKDYLKLTGSQSELVIFAQIPANYKVVKRNNVQHQIDDDNIVMITDNFYFFANRPNISYCVLDLYKDETKTENYVYPFLFKINSENKDNIRNSKIDLVLNEVVNK